MYVVYFHVHLHALASPSPTRISHSRIAHLCSLLPRRRWSHAFSAWLAGCPNPGLFAGLYSIAFSLGQRFTTGLPYAPPPVPQHGDNQELGRKIWLRQAL
ncbi:hypothetical protein CCHR01_07908 [Colletotrichum chrysophilum]|uniref:Uncharacterized protein n=1 Tax=Colletotrichum chrysophilum TaxID=1836956 RepID=A0AAD9AK50_9PEZI|nr:hypothetical protein CCHR01_07908 [Colletotrichum chrysophilum]